MFQHARKDVRALKRKSSKARVFSSLGRAPGYRDLFLSMFREKPVDDNKAASKIAVTSSLRSFPSVPYLSRLICSPEAKRIRPARSAHKWDQQKIISPRRQPPCSLPTDPPTKIRTERSDADTNAHSDALHVACGSEHTKRN